MVDPPCCDFRDHYVNSDGSEWCPCPDHPRSQLHPLGGGWLNVHGPCDLCGGDEFDDWDPDPRFGVCVNCGHCCGHKGPQDEVKIRVAGMEVTVTRDEM